MPVDFNCENCQLSFSVGWFHIDDFKSGYASILLLVCSKCGAQHRVRFAFRSRGEQYTQYFDVLLTTIPKDIRVAVMGRLRDDYSLSLSEVRKIIDTLPFTLTRKAISREAKQKARPYETLGASVEVIPVEKEVNPEYGPIQKDLFEVSMESKNKWNEIAVVARKNTPTGEFNIDEQKCGKCGADGQFIDDQRYEFSKCPRCQRDSIKMVGGWVT